MITTNAPQPVAAPSQPRPAVSRYTLNFGVALATVTVAALLLAFFASEFRPSGTTAIPASWSQSYHADLTTTNDGAWDETHGCKLTALGLDANAPGSSDALCGFQPSVSSSVTGAGFYFVTKVAPAAQVPSFARAMLSVGDLTSDNPPAASILFFVIGQDGSYTLCDGACSARGSAIYQSGGLAAWHGDAQVPNTIAVKVAPFHDVVTFYVNGQEVATVHPQLGPQPAIALGAPAGSEAIFTSATLYSGQ